jgi:hypothetical protein
MLDVSIEDLAIAYRRAKVDLWYRDEQRVTDLLDYEEHLAENLQSLRARLASADDAWVRTYDFVGSFTLMPKEARSAELTDATKSGQLLWSDPERQWTHPPDIGVEAFLQPRPPAFASFRVISRCSIDMHVLSTLWMLRVGDKLERRLSDSAMGSRLRRTHGGDLNADAPSSFKSYFRPYKKWRDSGLRAMERSLDAHKPVLALTADVTSFYHRLDPSFLIDADFLDVVDPVGMTADDHQLHDLFVASLLGWAQRLNADTGWRARGLPVGLPASAVVANLAMFEFDQVVERELKPIYYGRYVDDIILVIESDPALVDAETVWQWIIYRFRGLLEAAPVQTPDGERPAVRFAPPYLEASDVLFENKKNKIFHLNERTGVALLRSIRSTIDQNASAWRSLPDIPDTPNEVGTSVVVATTEDGRAAATLRDADSLSMRRSAFAIMLRDFEAYERDLDVTSWQTQRSAFFEIVSKHIFRDPRTLFEFTGYVQRILRLAIVTSDWSGLQVLLESLTRVCNLLTAEDADRCELRVKEYAEDGSADPIVRGSWRNTVRRQVLEALVSALPTDATQALVDDVADGLGSLAGDPADFTLDVLISMNARLFLRDLAHVPFRSALLSPDFVRRSGIPEVGTLRDEAALHALQLGGEIGAGLDLLGSLARRANNALSEIHPVADGSEIPAIAFATRPFNALELYLLLHGIDGRPFALEHPEEIQQILLALRGYMIDSLPALEDDGVVRVGYEVEGGTRRIALAMVKTPIQAWRAAVVDSHDRSRERYDRLSRVISEIIRRPEGTHYLLLPESSLPSWWFVRFAQKLQERRINLISGIEYRHQAPDVVRNQVWAALGVDGAGFPLHFVHRQDKQRPAPSEEDNLRWVGNKRLEPEVRWSANGNQGPPVIAHGDFRFALLICSELTNITYRSNLRGRVDALFVPEWNQDLHTFEALVESAALDIHAYIAQSNDRSFGDSRIRAPRAKEWERDILRLKGGTHDYAIVGEIDIAALRAHQSAHAAHSEKSKFKPVPDGFVIDEARRTIPSE